MTALVVPRAVVEFYREEPRDHRSQRQLDESLHRTLRATGKGQQRELEAVEAPGSEWLNDLWAHARTSRSQNARRLLPEAVLDHLEENPDVVLSEKDLSFLLALAVAVDVPLWQCVASIEILATLAEDGLTLMDPIVRAFLDALQMTEPVRRLAATQALWQCDAIDTAEDLVVALQSETHQEVKETIKHAIRVLRR